MNRIQEIISAYSELPELKTYNLSVEAINDFSGDVKVTITRGHTVFEREIRHNESLEWVRDTFTYPNTITPRSLDFNAHAIKSAYLNEFGDLVVNHHDGTIENFRIKYEQKDKIIEKLKLNLGKKLKL